jgi:hypothetical protein
MAQVVERLLCKNEALSSNQALYARMNNKRKMKKKKKKKNEALSSNLSPNQKKKTKGTKQCVWAEKVIPESQA